MREQKRREFIWCGKISIPNMDSFSLEERKEKLTEIFLSGISRRDEDVRSCW